MQLILLTLPIGNKDDLSARGLLALQTGRTFLAEDTRKLKDVFKSYDIPFIDKYIDSFHDQSGPHKLKRIFHLLEEKQEIIVASDAGSPILSDPAFPLVVELLKRGGQLKTIPGVNSITTALELSGLPPHPYTFYGFLPREEQKKKTLLLTLSKGTHIFFDSPKRIKKTLELLAEIAPDYQLAVCKELTKTYEAVYRFKAENYLQQVDDMVWKGEFVLVIYGGRKKAQVDSDLALMAEDYLKRGSTKKLAKMIAEILAKSSKDIYRLLQK